jgi:NADP-dependent 3-hydroxy acid dehydrogenase YdfG
MAIPLVPLQVQDVPAHRVSVVTGASSGLGLATALAFARLGWSVAVGARREDRLQAAAEQIRASGATAFAHRLDVTCAESVDSFFSAVERALGPAEVVVNNAGVSRPAPLHETPFERIRDEVATNLTGPIYVTRRALPSMLERRGGDLVFVSSDSTRHPRPRQTIYSATKAGLENFQQALAMELEGTGIRALTVRVGPALSEFSASWDPGDYRHVEYWRRYGLQRHGGVLPAEQVARAIVLAVTTPRGVLLDTIEIQPEAPLEPRA